MRKNYIHPSTASITGRCMSTLLSGSGGPKVLELNMNNPASPDYPNGAD